MKENSHKEQTCACPPGTEAPIRSVDDQLVGRLKALAHPVRLRIIELIHAHGGEICVCEIERHFDLTQPTISHHLKLLRDAGLIYSYQKGSWVHHFVDPAAFRNVQDYLATFAESPVPA